MAIRLDFDGCLADGQYRGIKRGLVLSALLITCLLYHGSSEIGLLRRY
jgi:hypothetical protein